jgi:FkbH-like protein
MFEPEFADKRAWSARQRSIQAWRSALPRSNVRKVQLLYWREHCLECAPPDCYYSCPLYVSRQDKRCARFEYGIYPNQSMEGLLPYAAEIKFRKWGKLGTNLYHGGVSPGVHNALSRLDTVMATILSVVYKVITRINPVDLLKIKSPNPQRSGYKIYAYIRERALRAMLAPNDSEGTYDVFVMECFSFENDAFNFILEYEDSEVRSRHAIEIKNGQNYREIPIREFNGTASTLKGTLNIYPENDKQVTVAFTWLDFVKKQSAAVYPEATRGAKPAEKVKCVAWDLDNTLWKGILIEDGKNKIALQEEAVRVIHGLDQRGIIQSVVSKNNQNEAMEVLAQFGLKDYFVYPVINWEPKSANMKRLASALNINVDSIALIDDSAFERAEVKSVLPECRVYSEEEISQILGNSEFDVTITDESRMRRKSYLSEMERDQTFKESGGNYEEFLRSCKMEMRIFVPREEAQIERCLELIQRSNQLNLSTKRYTEHEFLELLKSKHMLCVGFQCKDRFGDYGIVGFASVDEGSGDPRLVDLVISCRVAQKMVERTLIEWLVERGKGMGQRVLNAELVKTKRNGPLRSVFETLPFLIIEENETVVRMKLSFDQMSGRNKIIEAVVQV